MKKVIRFLKQKFHINSKRNAMYWILILFLSVVGIFMLLRMLLIKTSQTDLQLRLGAVVFASICLFQAKNGYRPVGKMCYDPLKLYFHRINKPFLYVRISIVFAIVFLFCAIIP